MQQEKGSVSVLYRLFNLASNAQTVTLDESTLSESTSCGMVKSLIREGFNISIKAMNIRMDKGKNNFLKKIFKKIAVTTLVTGNSYNGATN